MVGSAKFSCATVAAALFALIAVLPASAQLANADISNVGLSDNATATARRFGAIAVNPAGLALPGSEFSLIPIVLSARGTVGISPVALWDVKGFEGKRIDENTKADWMRKIDQDGERISASFEVSPLALTFRNLGLQMSSVAAVHGSVPPDVAEVLLYGNAGRTGEPKTLDLEDGKVDVYAMSSAGLAFALPIPGVADWGIGADHLAVGVTAKYVMGHVLAAARTSGNLTADPAGAELDAWLVYTDYGKTGNLLGSHGIGLDVGVMAGFGDLAVGAAVQNAFNTFSWAPSTLRFQPMKGELKLDPRQTGSSTPFETTATSYEDAPDVVKAVISKLTFVPAMRLGAAYDVLDDLTISGDVHYRFGDEGIILGPGIHVGVGVEYRVLEWLHLMGGGAWVTGGIQFGGGAAFILGPVNVATAMGIAPGGFTGQFVLSIETDPTATGD